jgi:cold shock CspA family protein
LEEGVVVKLSSTRDYGFIKPDNKSYRKDIIFHRTKLVNTRQFPSVGDRVQFYVTKRKDGYGANEIRVQVQLCTDIPIKIEWSPNHTGADPLRQSPLFSFSFRFTVLNQMIYLVCSNFTQSRKTTDLKHNFIVINTGIW